MTNYALTKTMIGCSMGEGDELAGEAIDEQLESAFIEDNDAVLPTEEQLPGYRAAVLVGGTNADGEAGTVGTAGLYARGQI